MPTKKYIENGIRITMHYMSEQDENHIEKLIRNLLPLLPSWVKKVSFEHYSGDNISIKTQYKYRSIRITTTPDFLSWDTDAQVKSMIHEFCHAILAPYSEFVDRLIKSFQEDNLKNYTDVESIEYLEMATQDMAELVIDLMGDG